MCSRLAALDLLAQLGNTTPHRITGFRGISGRLGSAEWFAGVGFVAALAAALVAPVLQLVGVVSPVSVLHAPWIQTTGIVIAVIGIVATVYAQVDMGDSWRIGVDPSETTTLVRTGAFGWVRNPIFTAMITFGFGIALVTPNLVRSFLYWRHDRIQVSSKSRTC